jgi:alkylation response protein AidB-like acyl-CoA dehydrogenase
VRELFLQNKDLVKKARQEYRSGVGFGPGVFGLMRKLGERGWLCPHWPEEYGGLGLSEMHHHIVMNEMDYFAGYGQQVGTGLAGPVIMRYGTERQKKKYLPPIARGEVEFALGYTEP